jgi:hypothetical protein
MQCTRCGFQSPPNATTACVQCGAPFTIGADPLLRAVLPVGRTPLAIVAGYAGLFSLLCLPAPIALGLGIWAVVDLKKRPGMHGMGRAVFAIVTGGIGTLAMLAWLVAAAIGRR